MSKKTDVSGRLPRPLKNWVDGLRTGSGPTSAPSHLTPVGGRPVLLPIVVSASRGHGLKRFLAVLGTSSAWREVATGEPILMLSLDLDREDFLSLIQSSAAGGGSGAITLDLSMPAAPQSGTAPSISPRRQTTGISVDECDHCRRPIAPKDAYVQFCDPIADSLRIVHRACVEKVVYFD